MNTPFTWAWESNVLGGEFSTFHQYLSPTYTGPLQPTLVLSAHTSCLQHTCNLLGTHLLSHSFMYIYHLDSHSIHHEVAATFDSLHSATISIRAHRYYAVYRGSCSPTGGLPGMLLVQRVKETLQNPRLPWPMSTPPRSQRHPCTITPST
ncbi:hypothetical protein K469DRAFT_160747 [Zopfia rhizophila CBS 207.26]|uniref:Uncharacterized protein n=1 Tax=Zopfia rhizophila CBS 207.26 TaxID=1314779 RepID=A0A6A6E0J5_9PEZI|nr:hypothetical protein K469DRAFT_160747 [Zopfia rhizophila CBS 207.26]